MKNRINSTLNLLRTYLLVISLSQSQLIDVNVSLELEIILTYTWFILHLFTDPNLFCNFNTRSTQEPRGAVMY